MSSTADGAPVELLGVFGGSFDPPHMSHVLAACWALATHPISRILVVPTAVHPYDKPLTSFAHRLEMCRLAFEPLRGVETCDAEATLPRPSYTVRTLEHLRERHPDTRLGLLVGEDLADDVERWHEGHRIRDLATLIVVGRAGCERETSRPLRMPDVSSTEMRERIRRGASVEGLVPHRVIEYIAQHHLYRGEA